MWWFTSDEHHNHKNILRYQNRPFSSIEEMNQTLINNHNSVVSPNDTVIHAGDFAFGSYETVQKIIKQLNGNNIFLIGSHDSWMKNNKYNYLWESSIEGQYVVVCHYAMLVWPKSHYGSIQLFGHSHSKLKHPLLGKQYDVGVDNNNFYPVSFEQIKKIMKTLPNNFNLIKDK